MKSRLQALIPSCQLSVEFFHEAGWVRSWGWGDLAHLCPSMS